MHSYPSKLTERALTRSQITKDTISEQNIVDILNSKK